MIRKICVVITARASYAKIKPILESLKNERRVQLQVVCAASAVLDRFGNVQQVIEDDGFKVDEALNFLLEGENLCANAKATGLGLIEFAGAFSRLKPDIVVVMADRFEVISAAVAASYQNITLAHVQGGEVSGNIDEKVRHAITKLADIHFPATERAKNWLERMGENPEMIFLTGCPSIDIAKSVLEEPKLDFNIYEKYKGVGKRPDLGGEFYIVMQHPVTSEQNKLTSDINETLEAVSELGKPSIWFWPNSDAGGDEVSKTIRSFREKMNVDQIHFIKNMEPIDFLRLLNLSSGIIGNSSAAIREASFLGVPAINIGSRQADRERGENVFDTVSEKHQILHAIKAHFTGRKPQSIIYGNGCAGAKVGNILANVELRISKRINYLND